MKNNEERVKSIMKKVENRKRQRGEVLTATTMGLCAILGLFLYTNIDNTILDVNGNISNKVSGDFENKEFAQVEEIILPTFSSKQEIIEKLKETNNNRYFLTDDAVIFDQMAQSSPTTSNSAITTGSQSKVYNTEIKELSKNEYSTTNVQVNGVDEGDIVKTNGDYIYYINNNNLYIFETKTTKTKLVKTIKLTEKNNIYGEELYIDDNYITVIIQESINRDEINILKEEDDNEKLAEQINLSGETTLSKENRSEKISDKIYTNVYTTVTSMYVYDINSYELIKTVKSEGDYISSRKIGNNIYMVTNRNLYYYRIDENNILPIYLDVANMNDLGREDIYKEVSASCIRYFPDIKEESNYMIITSINLDNIEDNATVEIYLGAGTEIYCSKENLYVTKVERPYNYYGGLIEAVSINDDTIERENTKESGENVNKKEENKIVTKIHKFNLLDGAVKYVATGKVVGALLNQYSMDENNGYFRITTTSNAGNSLYVLNEKLETVGELENLAKGEKIYATRFMGDKCYIVTYKTVDPLFVIDLNNPENPTVLGELKLPGYSTYLHPLGENYLIGFGEDSIEKNYIDWEGKSQVTAYNVGLKLAIFDVSDLENPKEIHSVRIGGRGSTSELLNNPKTLYYDTEAEIFAFTAMLCEETKYYEDGTPRYGDMIFNGALVYDLNVENGINLRGKIEHEGTKKYGSEIERIISIGENFYTISPKMIKVTNIETMKELEEVKF